MLDGRWLFNVSCASFSIIPRCRLDVVAFPFIGGTVPEGHQGQSIQGRAMGFALSSHLWQSWWLLSFFFNIRHEPRRNIVASEIWFSPLADPLGPQRWPPASGRKIHYSRARSGCRMRACLVLSPSIFLNLLNHCCLPHHNLSWHFVGCSSNAHHFPSLQIHHLRHFIFASWSLSRGYQMPPWCSFEDRRFIGTSCIVSRWNWSRVSCPMACNGSHETAWHALQVC